MTNPVTTLWSNARTMWRNQPKAMAGFLLAAAVTVFFTVRIVVSAIYWHNPAHIHEPVKSWMTMGYVARSWGLHGPDIDAAAGLPRPEKGHPFTIAEIARQRGVPEAQIIQLVEETIARLQAAKAAGGNDPAAQPKDGVPLP